jgi:branched-subunit amino acid aminotransferase/4-amino-4-deoxychorismate lyase
MPINWNSEILDALPTEAALAQRACWYADGLFETLRMSNSALPWLEWHWRRLEAGLRALEFDIPAHWDAPFWATEIRKIASGHARIRLQVWRAPGGLYLPAQAAPVYAITAEPLANAWFAWREPGIRLGLANNCRICSDAYSGFKSLNTARYVAASLEARRMGWDEAVVLNAFDRVAEACAANIFWFEKGALCTTLLSEGCVAGVTRGLLIRLVGEIGLAVQEKTITFAALQAADEVFLTNAIQGIIPVAELGGRAMPSAAVKNLFEWFSGLQTG